MSIGERREILSQAAVYVVGLVVDHDGKIKPFALGKPVITPERLVAPQSTNQIVVAPENEQSIETPLFTIKPVPDLDSEYLPIDKLSYNWRNLCSLIADAIHSHSVWFVVLFFVAMMAIVVVRRRVSWFAALVPLNVTWEREIVYFSSFVLIGSLLFVFRNAIGVANAIYIFAAMCFYGMVRARFVPPFEESFLGRLKDLVGLILGSLIVPLLFKAYLIQCGM